jgi:hypothetical protein
MRRASPIAIAALLTAATLLVAACGGSAATPASVPATPAPTAEAVATPTATAEPTTKPTPKPYEFASSAYDYVVTLPGVSVAKQALQPWDGESRIDWVGPHTDQVILPGDVRFFVYGSPTDLDLADYAAMIQAQSATWHDCPAQPSDVTDLAVGETIGQLARMRCVGDAYVQKLVLVGDGEGLVVNLLAEPAVDTGEADALFEELVAAMTWPAGS